eukprot:6196561-Pleurochrysis_carterae.AAC.1
MSENPVCPVEQISTEVLIYQRTQIIESGRIRMDDCPRRLGRKRQTCETGQTQLRIPKCDVTTVLPHKLSGRPSVHDLHAVLSPLYLATSFDGAGRAVNIGE